MLIIILLQMNKRTIIILALLICLFFDPCLAQRGGSSRSRRSRSSSGLRTSHSTTKCQMVNGVKQCKKSSNGSILWILFAIPFFIYDCITRQSEQSRRKKKIDRNIKEYIAKHKHKPCSLNEYAKKSIVSKLKKGKFIQRIMFNNEQENFKCDLSVVKFQKMENLIYKIELKGQDKIGSSVFEGVIIFKQNGFGIKFSKTYKDREKANQTRNFSCLFYQGEGNWDLVLGNWYFLGFQGSNKYSGSWSMMTKV